MQQVEPQGATFLYIESDERYAHGTFIWLYEPGEASGAQINRESLIRHVKSRLEITHVLYQRLARVPWDLDYPYWVDAESFDLNDHVHESKLPKPGSWQQFCQVVAEVHSVPLDLEKPLWEMHLIRGLDVDWLPKGAFAILTKAHHVAIDGATGMAIIRGLHDLQPFSIADEVDAQQSFTSERAPGFLGMLGAAAVNNLSYSIKSVKAAAGLVGRLPRILTSVRLATLFSGDGAPHTPFNQDVSAVRRVGLRFFELQDITKIRYAVPGATVNDVFLTICAGALRRFLESHGELPENSMVAGCPINVRTDDESESGGNRISAMTTLIHTNIADPLERLKAIQRSTTRSKTVVDAIGAREMLELNNNLPSALQSISFAVAQNLPDLIDLRQMFNCPISNLPGPQEPLYLGRAKMLQIGCAMPVMNGFGLFIGICTYDGKLCFTISSADNIIPEPEQLMRQFDHAVAELRRAAGLVKPTIRTGKRHKKKKRVASN